MDMRRILHWKMLLLTLLLVSSCTAQSENPESDGLQQQNRQPALEDERPNNKADTQAMEGNNGWYRQKYSPWPARGRSLPYNNTIGLEPLLGEVEKEWKLGAATDSYRIFQSGSTNPSEDMYEFAKYCLPSLFEYPDSRSDIPEEFSPTMLAATTAVARSFEGCYVFKFSNPLFALLVQNGSGYPYSSLKPVFNNNSLPSKWTVSPLNILFEPYPYKIFDPKDGEHASLEMCYQSDASFLCGGLHRLPISKWKVVDADHGPVLEIYGLESDYIKTVWHITGGGWGDDVVDVILNTDGKGELIAITESGLKVSGQLVWQINDLFRQDSSWTMEEDRGPIVVDWIEIQGDELLKFRPPQWIYLPK